MTDTGSVFIATSIVVCDNLADGSRCPPGEQIEQLGDVGGHAPCLVAGEQPGRGASWQHPFAWPRLPPTRVRMSG